MYLMVLDGNYVGTSYTWKNGKDRKGVFYWKAKRKKKKTRNIELNCGLREDWRIQYDTHSILIRFEVLHPSAEQGGNSSTRILVLFVEIKCGVLVCLFVRLPISYPIIPNSYSYSNFFLSFPPPHQVPAIEVVKKKKKILLLWNHV